MSNRTFTFEVTRTSTAPPATLFRLETDGARWSDWAKPIAMQSSWESQGDPAPGGIGAIRRIGLWPIVMREKTVEYEQDVKHVYTFVGWSPAKDYRGTMLLTPNASGGTDLRWTGTFTEAVPGTGPLVRAVFRAGIVMISKMLINAANHEKALGATA